MHYNIQEIANRPEFEAEIIQPIRARLYTEMVYAETRKEAEKVRNRAIGLEEIVVELRSKNAQ